MKELFVPEIEAVALLLPLLLAPSVTKEVGAVVTDALFVEDPDGAEDAEDAEDAEGAVSLLTPLLLLVEIAAEDPGVLATHNKLLVVVGRTAPVDVAAVTWNGDSLSINMPINR